MPPPPASMLKLCELGRRLAHGLSPLKTCKKQLLVEWSLAQNRAPIPGLYIPLSNVSALPEQFFQLAGLNSCVSTCCSKLISLLASICIYKWVHVHTSVYSAAPYPNVKGVVAMVDTEEEAGSHLLQLQTT